MKRLIDQRLNDWKGSASRKPLLLFGARQVGKTYALKHFGEMCFDNFVHIDFSKDASAVSIFEGSLDPERIVATVEALSHKAISPDKTLIIFDEIQACERAITSLKYFCEDAPQYHVVAAGSLLGVKLREKGSFPVGKVDLMALHSLNFEEFLWACEDEKLSANIEECAESLEFCPLHEEALLRYYEYLLVGGMPDVVNAFVASKNNEECDPFEAGRKKQTEIDQAYIADIAKHAPVNLVPKIIDVWKSIPSQLAKENSKFQYKSVRSGGRASIYEESVAWLNAAGVVSKCTRVTEPVAPLGIFEDSTNFKLFRSDVGILSEAYGALPADVLPQAGKASRFRGALAENYVMQQFTSADAHPNYWGTPSKQEVDFVARNKQGDVIPMEVKSGANVRANSLKTYREKYEPPYVARFSTKNFGTEMFVQSIPLYAACYYAKNFINAPVFM